MVNDRPFTNHQDAAREMIALRFSGAATVVGAPPPRVRRIGKRDLAGGDSTRYADWAAPHRERLTALHEALTAGQARALLECRRPEEAVALLEPLAADRPNDEPLHRVLMEALDQLTAPAARELTAARNS